MKKAIIASIFLFYIFAIQNTYADCYYNYPYNGQYVTYCFWDNNYNSNYNYNYNTSYNYNNYQNYNYQNNYSNYTSSRTNEENYYNLLNLNWISTNNNESKSDFFKDNVLWNDVEFDKLDAIKINSYSFKSATYNSKYSDALKFISGIKSLTKSKYSEWKIDYYEIYDIINDLDYLAENLNNQFLYYKKFETTWNSMYKDLSLESATLVRTNYNKLKFTLNSL